MTRTAPWAWAYALRTVGGDAGYVVVGADEEPSARENLVLRAGRVRRAQPRMPRPTMS